MIFKISLLICTIVFSGAPIFHPIKVTYNNIKKEDNQWIWEVRFFKDDFNDSFKTLINNFDVYDGISEKEREIVFNYVSENTMLIVNDSFKKLTQNGHHCETEKTITFTFHIAEISEIKKIDVTNTIFFEFFEDQSNIVKITKTETENYTVYLVKGYGTESITF